MHVLAYCYHWDRETLWNLTRTERKMWSDMVLEQRKAENPDSSNDAKDSNSYKESK